MEPGISRHPKISEITDSKTLKNLEILESRYGSKEVISLLNHPNTTKNHLGEIVDAASKRGIVEITSILNHSKTTEGNTHYIISAVSKYGPNAITPILDHPNTTANNLWHLAFIVSKYGPNAITPILDHPKTTVGNLGFVTLMTSKHGPTEATLILDHPKTNKANLAAVAQATLDYPPGAITPILDHPKTNKANLAAVAAAVSKYGIKRTLAVWDHPKTTVANINAVAKATPKQDPAKITPILDHPKTTTSNLGDVAHITSNYSIDEITQILDHPKTTTSNLGDVAHAITPHGIKPTLAAWDHPKTNTANLADVAAAASKHGIKPTLAAWDHPRTSKDSVWAVSFEASKHGIKPTLAAWDHPKTNTANLADVAAAASKHGIKPTLAAWDHPNVTGENIGYVAAAASKHGIEPTLLAMDHVDIASLFHSAAFVSGIPKARARKLLSCTWRDLADGRLDFSKLTPEERLLVTAKLTKASSPENSYKHGVKKFRAIASRHDINHPAAFQMDVTIPVRVRTAAKPSPEAFKLATHFIQKPLTQQLAYSLHQLGHDSPTLKRLRAGKGTKEDEAALDDLLRAEKLGSLGNPEQTVEQIIRKRPVPGTILPLIPEIARQRGYALSGFNGSHNDNNFVVMREFMGDTLPHYLSDKGIKADIKKLQDRFKLATKGRARTRKVRLWSGQKAMPHAFYDLLGHTCVVNSDTGFNKGVNTAHRRNFSPVTMFDAKTGELLGVIYIDKNGKRLESFGFEPLDAFTNTVADKNAFVKDAYGAVAEAAHKQGLKVHASAAAGEVSNRDTLIDIIKAHGVAYRRKKSVQFPTPRRVSMWLNMPHKNERPRR